MKTLCSLILFISVNHLSAQKVKGAFEFAAGYQFHHYSSETSNGESANAYVEDGNYHGLTLNNTYYYSTKKNAPFLQGNISIFNKQIEENRTPFKYERYIANYNGTYLNLSVLCGLSMLSKKNNRFNVGYGVRGLGVALRNGWIKDYQAKSVTAPNGQIYINSEELRMDYGNNISTLSKVFTNFLLQIEVVRKLNFKSRNLTYRIGASNGGVHLVFGIAKN